MWDSATYLLADETAYSPGARGRSAVNISSRADGALGEHRRQCEIVTVEGIPASARKIEGRTSSV